MFMHKEKQKVCEFFVPRSGQALLCMPYIETLGVLTTNCESIGRQLASDNNAEKRKRNWILKEQNLGCSAPW